MNKKRYLPWKILLPVLVVSLFVSCDDFFETEVGGRIDPSVHYKSQLDAEMSYMGSFAYLQDIAEKSILVDGLRSDLMDVTESADADMIAINNHDFSASNIYIDPSSYYKLIININEVLPNLPDILEIDRDFDSLTLHLYTGAMITMRSWAYFNLAKLNGTVGWIDGNLTEIDAKKPPAYLNKGQVVLQLISDLTPYIDPADITRFPIDHYVLLGELFMELGDYGSAVKYFKYALDGPAYKNIFMVGDTYERDAWELIFVNSNSQYETVQTAIAYSFVNQQKNTLEEWMNYKFDFMVKPTDTIISLFASDTAQNDEIGDLYRGMGTTIDTTSTGVPYINKYSLDEGIPHSADVILYRAADVHLMMAEALNRYGNHDMALILLNNGVSNLPKKPAGYTKWSKNKGVRGRVYMKEKKISESILDPTEIIEDLIIEERAKELAFEGKRWFDLVRIATRRNDPAYLADKVAAKFGKPGDADYDAMHAKLMDPVNWYIPLPQVD
jgi:starch-binding outer membrane protein, SusD/RagB family